MSDTTKTERMRSWAEGLIRQLPEGHEGRNSWLLNYGHGPDVEKMRDEHPTYRSVNDRTER